MPKKRRLFSTRDQTMLTNNDYRKSEQGKIIPLERKSTSELRSIKTPTELNPQCRLQRKDLKLNMKKILNENKRSIPLKSCLSSQRHGEKLKMKVKFYLKKSDNPFGDRPTCTDSAQDVNKNMRKGKEFVTTHQAGAMLKNKKIGYHRRSMAGDFDIKSKQKQNNEKTAENNYQINESIMKKSLAGKIRNMIVEKSKQLSDTSIRYRHVRKSLEMRSFNSHSSINYHKFKERLNKHDMKYQTVCNNHASKNISTANNSLNGKYKQARKNNLLNPTLCDTTRLKQNKQNRKTRNKLSNFNPNNINTVNSYDDGNLSNYKNYERNIYENPKPNLSAVVYQDICVTGRKLKLWKKYSEAKKRSVLSLGIGRKTSNNNIKYYSNERNKKRFINEVKKSKLKENQQVLDDNSKLDNDRKENNVFNKSEQVYQTEIFSKLFKTCTNKYSKNYSSTTTGKSSIYEIPYKSEVTCKNTALNLKQSQNNESVICPERTAGMKKLQENKSTEPKYWNDHLESSRRHKHIQNLFIKELNNKFSSVAKTKTNRVKIEQQGKIIRNQIFTSLNDKPHYNLPINNKSTRLKNGGKTSEHKVNKQEPIFLINRILPKETKNRKEYTKSVNERNIMLSRKFRKAAKKNETHVDSQNIPHEIDSLLSKLLMKQTPRSEHLELPNKMSKRHTISTYPNKLTNDLQIRDEQIQKESTKSCCKLELCQNWWRKCIKQIKHTFRQLHLQISDITTRKHRHAPVSSTKYISSSDRFPISKFTKLAKETILNKERSMTDKKDLEIINILSKNNPSVKETKNIYQDQTNNITTDCFHKQHTLSESRRNEVKKQIISECKKSLFDSALEKQNNEIHCSSTTHSITNKKLNTNQQSKFFEEAKTTRNLGICDGNLFKIEPVNMNVYQLSIKADESYTAPHLESEELIMVSDYEQTEHSSRLNSKQTSICQKQCSKSDSFLEQHRERKVVIDEYLKDSKHSVINESKKTHSESLKNKIRCACKKSCPDSEANINQRTKSGHIVKYLNDYYLYLNDRQIKHNFIGKQKTKSKFYHPFLENKPEKIYSGYGTSATKFDKGVPEHACVIHQRTIGTSYSRLNENIRNVACGSKKRYPKNKIQKDKGFNCPCLPNNKINCDACKDSDNTFVKRLCKCKENLKQKKCAYNTLLKECTCYFKHCDDKSVIERQLRENQITQKRPFLYIYKMFPRAYPHLLYFMLFAKHTYRFCLMILAYMTWIPWIFVAFVIVLIIKYGI